MIKHKSNLSKVLEELKNDKNNAISSVFETSLNQKKGILSGAIFTIKDNFATKDFRTEASSKTLKNFFPCYDADVFKFLLEEGATCVAKTNLDELGMGGTGTFSAKGIILNPLDKRRIVGGSSSGSAASFTKLITFTIGSDTGDSIRRPAALVGKVGFKPSYGAVSRYGLFAYASSLDTVGWITHNISDSFLVAKALFKPSKRDLTSVFVGLDRDLVSKKPKVISYFEMEGLVDDFVWRSFQKLLNNLKLEGISLNAIKPNIDILEASQAVYRIISFSEASSNLAAINGITFGGIKDGHNWEDIYTNTRSQFGVHLKKRVLLGTLFLNQQNQKEIFLKAQKLRRVVKDYMEGILEGCDFFLIPSQSGLPPLFGEHEVTKLADNLLAMTNLYGSPSIVMKYSEYQNLPLNISLETLIYEDSKLLAYALWMENFINGK